MTRRAIVLGTAALASATMVAGAQQSGARCDSIIAASAVDTVSRALYISLQRLDPGQGLTADEEDRLATSIVQAFRAPRPFRVSVFEGPASMRGLRRAGSDTVRETRAASVTGVYSVFAIWSGATPPEVQRSSLLIGLDSAMVRSIAAAADVWREIRNALGGFPRFQIRLTNDSTDGAHLLASGSFPRMPVHDAAALPAAAVAFPEEARADSLEHGETVLRFIVDRDGEPALETVEVVRTSGVPFARAALAALRSQHFSPATIRGCPIAQVVEFPFIFDAAPQPPWSDR